MARPMPSLRTVGIICAAVVVAGVATVVGITIWANGPAPAAQAGRSSTPGQIATTSGPATPGGSSGAVGGTVPGTASSSGAGATAQAAPAPTPTDASELSPGVPQTPPTQPAPSLLPTGPSLTGPLPPAASARGEQLVVGFPAQVVPVLDGIQVVSSSVASEGLRLQVGLEASSSADPATVTSRYATTFRDAGFVLEPSPALPGSTATQFTRGPDGVVLTVSGRVGGGTELIIAATLTTTG